MQHDFPDDVSARELQAAIEAARELDDCVQLVPRHIGVQVPTIRRCLDELKRLRFDRTPR